MLTANREIELELEIDKFERNHENDSTSLFLVTFLNVLIVLIKFSVRLCRYLIHSKNKCL